MLTKDLIMKSFERLSKELAAIGMQGEILLTGGAAMCLVHSARDMTKDIDAVYEPKTIINQLAARIAVDEGLPSGWLNDSVKGFITDAAPRESFLILPSLKITTVSADYLLAMKLLSARYGETDYEDVKFLMNELGVDSVEALERIVTTYYPPDRILPKTKYLIEQLVNELKEEGEV